MSQYSWFFVNKNYLLFAMLASVLAIPVGFVTAELIFAPTESDVESNSLNSFDNLNGPRAAVTFLNTTDNFALIASFDDDSVTLVDMSNPKNIVAKDVLDGSNDGTGTSEGNLVLEGATSIVLVENSTDRVGGNFAVVGSYLDDGIQIIHTDDERSDTAHALYPTLNMTAGTNDCGACKGFDGVMDVAVFGNYTFATTNMYAVVTGHVGDAIQLIDISDPEAGGQLYALGHGGNNISNATSTGGNNVGGADIDYPTVGNYGGALPLDGAHSIDIFYDTAAGNMPYAIVTGQVSDGFQIFSLNDTGKGLVPFQNKTKSDSGFELLDSPTGVAVWNTTNHNNERFALIASNYTDSVTVVHLLDPGAPTVLDTMENNAAIALDGAYEIDISKVGDRHYAFIASNGTASTTGSATNVIEGGIQVIDLYNPSNIQAVASVVDETSMGNALTVQKIAGASGISTFTLDGHTYAAVTSYTDDAVTIIKITNDKKSDNNKQCDVSYDCTSPTISSNGGGISINGAALSTSDRFNDVDLETSKVGQMVTIKAKIYDAYGVNEIFKSNLYFDMPHAIEWGTADAAIKYDIMRDEVDIVDNNDIFDATVSASKSGSIVTVTYKIMFTDEMEKSHIALQSIDNSRNYQLKYFRDALEVTGTPTQTSGELTANDEITQTSTASVPDWVKNTAGWWAEGAISEGEFVKGVEFLIQQQIIDTNVQTSSSEGTGASVPDWVKNTAGWWADGAISEGEFVNAIEHLVKTGTIIII